MVSRSDPETLRILNDVILLLVPANPDGMELVSNWYMREADPKRRNMDIPRLYQKYVGHDNNRDSYNNSQPETEAISRQMYIEWFPQIMYNQHQTGPAGTVLFIAPFRDPFNYNQDPLVPMGLDLVGGAIHTRFIAENKPGAVLRNAAGFSTWFNGGIRTTAGFHNQIGILTEIIGNPTPMSIPLVPDAAAAQRRPAVPDRAAADLAPAPVDRIRHDGQPRHPRRRLHATATSGSTASTGWGRTRSSAAAATTGRSRRRGSGRCRRRSKPAWGADPSRPATWPARRPTSASAGRSPPSTTPPSARRTRAIRAGTSFRRTSPTS